MSENQTGKTVVAAPDIVCGGCAEAIKKAFAAVGGVSGVNVNVDEKTVSVEHERSVSRERIIEILDRAGFEAS